MRERSIRRTPSLWRSQCILQVFLQLHICTSPENDVIEKMHIHYGLKAKNPVGRLRFFQKNCKWDTVAKELNENVYLASMPNRFEEFAVRVFCKSHDIAKRYCKTIVPTVVQGEVVCNSVLLPVSEDPPSHDGFPNSQLGQM